MRIEPFSAFLIPKPFAALPDICLGADPLIALTKPVNSATGDDFNIALYGSPMVVSVTALVVLLLLDKKRIYAK